MKTKLYFRACAGRLFLVSAVALGFSACKKDAAVINTYRVSAFSKDMVKSDGIITVQTGILPPVTQQSFIANGNTSTAEFQVSATQHIFLYDMYFTATYPAIQYITIKNYGLGNGNGNIEFNGGGDIAAGGGSSFIVQIHYNNVDSNSSGETAQLCLTNIVYRTDDNVYHTFYAANTGKAQTMCLVNNIPHITFQDPSYTDNLNGCREIAEIKLSGDTGWTLNALPLNIYSPYDATIAKSKLIIRSEDKMINTKSDSITLQAGNTIQAIVNFTGGFDHVAGKTEILKIYAPVEGSGYNALVTSMFPLSSFLWTDGLGAKLSGAKNNRFFKQSTGQSNFH
ncbi:MAG: hypothetical protein JO072_10050 [Parafilimonas sp.]|nr:hypothetical protein [Parafilimonas sp.]